MAGTIHAQLARTALGDEQRYPELEDAWIGRWLGVRLTMLLGYLDLRACLCRRCKDFHMFISVHHHRVASTRLAMYLLGGPIT